MTKTLSQLRNVAFIVSFVLILFGCENVSNPNNIRNHNSDNFQYLVYDQTDSSIILIVSEELQRNYERILIDLSVEDIPKITIKIWGSYSHFLSDMQNDIGVIYNGATGYIFGPTEIRVYKTNNVAKDIVHEFIHVVSMYVNPTIPNNPRWLWETIALYENNEFHDPNNISYLVDGRFPKLSELNGDFIESKKIYEVGYLLGEFILQKYGKELFVQLIKNNGDIQNTFNISEIDFEKQWELFVKTKYF